MKLEEIKEFTLKWGRWVEFSSNSYGKSDFEEELT
jgi:hypothetical protein